VEKPEIPGITHALRAQGRIAPDRPAFRIEGAGRCFEEAAPPGTICEAASDDRD
jgi:hypothetical protein